MQLFDMLDRESDRLIEEFRTCVASTNDTLDDAQVRALLGRATALCFALEHVMYPTSLAVGVDVEADVMIEHARLKEQIANALLESDRTRKRISSVYRRFAKFIALLRRSLYPQLYKATSKLGRSVVAEGLLRCLDANAGMLGARRPAPPMRQSSRRKNVLPAHISLDRVPILHDVVHQLH